MIPPRRTCPPAARPGPVLRRLVAATGAMLAGSAAAICPLPGLWSTWYDSPGGSLDAATDVAVAPGGDVIVAGLEYRGDLVQSYNWLVRRYASDGTFVSSWSFNGAANGNDIANAVAVNTAGDVFAGGYVYVSATGNDWLVQKRDAGGTLLWSRTFASGGFSTDAVEDLAADPGGGCVAAGWGGFPVRWIVRRYAADGTVVWSRTASPAGNAYSVALDVAGNAYVAGSTFVSGQSLNWIVQKYDPAGALLWSASYNSPANLADEARGVAVRSDGLVAVAGYADRSDLGADDDWLVRVYDGAGTLQWSVSFSGLPGQSDRAHDVAWRPDGLLVVAGDSYQPNATHWRVRTYLPDGTPAHEDLYTGAPSTNQSAAAVAVDAAGRTYAAGTDGWAWHIRASAAAPPGPCLTCALTATPSPWTGVGGSITVVLTVRNGGSTDVANVTPALGWTPVPLATPGTGPVPGGGVPIPAGGTASFAWTLVAAASGWGTLSATVTGTDPSTGDPLSAAATAMFGVTAVWPIPPGPADSQGTEYWLTLPSKGSISTPLEISVIVGSQTNAAGAVCVPGAGFMMPFAVTAGGTTSVYVPTDAVIPKRDVVENRGIQVVADADVSVYLLARETASTDACLGLPVDVLGHSYLVLGYGPELSSFDLQSEFALVATADDTIVTITPAVAAGGRAAGVPYQITLDRGQTYALFPTTPGGGDLTGSAVSADKPVAVFGGHQCADVPSTAFACDFIFEQLTPLEVWGCEFATMPLATRLNGDTFRVLASRDGTTVQVNGTPVTTLNRGQFHEWIVTGPAHLTANEPVLVAQYSNGSTWDGVTSDPFMMLVPPTWQYLSAYTVATPVSGFTSHHLNLVAPWSSTAAIQLDGAPLPAGAWTVIGGSGYSGREVTVAPGTHALAGTAPFAVWSYGFGDYDSYGYPGGMFFPEPEVRLSVTVSARFVPPGGLLTYTIAAVTFGVATPLNVVIWDTLPGGVTFASATAGGAWDGAKVLWTLPSLVPGITQELSVTVQVSSTLNGDYIGPTEARTTHDNQPACRADQVSPPIMVFVARPVLVVAKTATRAMVTCDARRIGYRLSWSNAGEATALGVTLTDTLPGGAAYRTAGGAFWAQPDWMGSPALAAVAYATAAGGPWTPGLPADDTPAPLVIRWTVDRIAPRASGYLEFSVDASAMLAGGAILANALSATRADSATPAFAPAVTAVVRVPALVVTKSADPPDAAVGDTATWRLLVRSTGGDTAWNVTVWDTLAAGTAFTAGDPAAVAGGGAVTWALPPLPPGASTALWFTVSLAGAAAPSATNVAAAAWTDCGGATWTATRSAAARLDVRRGVPMLTKDLAPPGAAAPGALVDYVLGWRNAGTATLTGFTILDTLPGGLTVVTPGLTVWTATDWLGTPAVAAAYAPDAAGPWTAGPPPDGAGSPLVLRWIVDRIVPGASGALAFRVAISATLPTGTILTNGAGATADWIDGEVFAARTVTVSQPQLVVSKSATGSVVPVGGLIGWEIGVVNAGSATAWAVAVRDTLPAGAAFAGCAGGTTCWWDGAAVRWTADPLPPGAFLRLTVTATAGGALSCSNWAEASYETGAGTPRPDERSNPVCVGLVAPAISIALLPDVPVRAPGPPLGWRILVTNTGDDTATALAPTLNWDPGLTFWSSTPTGTVGAAAAGWTLPDLPPGGTATVYVSHAAPPTDCDPVGWVALAGAAYANSAGVLQPAVISATAGVTLINASLRLALAPSVTVVQVGATVTFTLSWSNPCSDTAWAPVVFDTLPPGLAWGGGQAPPGVTCGPVAGGVRWTWTAGGVAPGGAGMATFTATATAAGAPLAVLPPVTGWWTNVDGVPLTTVAGAATVWITAPRLTAVKEGPGHAEGRDPVAFRIVVTNAGDDTAFSVRIVDSLPDPLAARSAAPPWSGSAASAGGRTLTWSVSALDIGASVVITLVAGAASDETEAAIINLAWATGRSPRGVPVTSPPGRADVALGPRLEFHVTPSPFDPGKAVRGTLKFTGLPARSVVRLYTLAGALVRRLDTGRAFRVEWDGRNDAGVPCATGTYLYAIEIPDAAGGSRWVRGKFGLVR